MKKYLLFIVPFILALRPGEESSVTCSCWKSFASILNYYVANNNRIIYASNIYQITNYSENFSLIVPTSQDPSLAIFENGKLKKQYIYTVKNTPAYWNNKDAFKEMIEDVTESPSVIYISEEQANTIKSQNDINVISYVRKSCGDCSFVLPNVLLPYINEHKGKTVYLLDMEDLNIYGSDIYQDFKDESLLSEKNNPDYGFSTGVVPTTFAYKNGTILDGNVFFNDTVEKDEEGYYISESYFSILRKEKLHYLDNVENPILEGIRLDESDVNVFSYEGNDYYFWSQTSAKQYHTPLFEAFLDKYL